MYWLHFGWKPVQASNIIIKSREVNISVQKQDLYVFNEKQLLQHFIDNKKFFVVYHLKKESYWLKACTFFISIEIVQNLACSLIVLEH